MPKLLFTRKKTSLWVWLSLAIAVIVLDRLSKWLALQHLGLHIPEPIVPFFNLYLDYNQGAAFSFLKSAGGWQRWFLSGISITMSLLLIIWLKYLPMRARLLGISLSLILGGALGNGWDRIYHGYVIDFIQLYVNNYYWPTFNIADSAIFIGAVLLAIDIFFKDKR